MSVMDEIKGTQFESLCDGLLWIVSSPYLRLLHEGDQLRCFWISVSVTYVSTLPSPSSSAPCISSFVQSLDTFDQMCENGTSCNILYLPMQKLAKMEERRVSVVTSPMTVLREVVAARRSWAISSPERWAWMPSSTERRC